MALVFSIDRFAIYPVEDLLLVRQLSCERGGLYLFHNLDLSIRPSELVQITGPNGCGKTTLLRLLVGLGEPTAGEIKNSADSMLYLGHRVGIKKRLSPLENLRWYFPEKTDKQICAALQEWRLSGYESVRCEQLSAGQQQRVALARLSLSDDALCLLDEPFTSIDREGVAQLEQCLYEKSQAGAAILFTSHHIFSQTDAVRNLNLQDYLP